MQKNKKITTEEYNNAINTNLTIIGKKEKAISQVLIISKTLY